ncbi:hypothetical protein ACOSQ2_030671 [Xanthoceras sorbifolium]
MDLEVVGRHALLFDDDSNASFVNSAAALVEWNSLSIDRYDVRHLLSAPPPRVKRRHNLSPLRRPESPSQSELDHERFLDLPSTSPSEEEHKQDDGAGPVNDGSYRAVPFSYGSADEPSGDRNADAESVFRPPFSLPENLLQNLPPTEKVHQIIARTAMFVSKHGGQSEIVLRVKQGDNPTFGFLMPDHHLHDYFRFLVDHPELLSEENKMDSELEQTSGAGRGGALSLLGSVYGSGEDEDGADEDAPELKRNGSEDAVVAANATVLNQSERTTSPAIVAGKDETVSKLSLPPLKEKMPLIKRNQSISTVKTRTSSGMKKDGDALGSVGLAADKSQVSASPSMSKVEPPIVEPPSDVKRVIDKIVEFVLRNGKEFEAVLVEQDRKHGRFPFLLPSNLYYPYYRKVVRKAEESKLPGKGFSSEKHDSTGLGVDKKRATSKESDTLSIGSDIPYDSDRKEKFKMVIGKLKKDGQDPPTKAATQTNVGVTVDAAAAAAILQAATRGIRNCNLEILTRMSLNGSGQGPSGEGGQGSSASVPVANATSEADSSEAILTSEQKLKAERLKRAKEFAAMVKNKAAPLKTEPWRGLSVEPPEAQVSGSGAEVVNLVDKEREDSSVPPDVDTSDVKEKSEKKDFGYDHERRSKRSYRSRSKKNEEEEDEEEEEEKKDHKHSKRKRKSHRSSHESGDRKRHSSSKDSDSRRQREHDNSSDHVDRHSSKHRHKHDNMSDDDDDRQSRDRHSSSDDEHHHSRHHHKHSSSHGRRRHRHDSSSDDEHKHRRRRSSKHRRKRSHSEKEVDLEEGEIKSDQSKASESYAAAAALSREASVDLSKSSSYQDGRASSQPSNTSEVSDDLRAKIRAMLMATL